jgi:hypothetical protein
MSKEFEQDACSVCGLVEEGGKHDAVKHDSVEYQAEQDRWWEKFIE